MKTTDPRQINIQSALFSLRYSITCMLLALCASPSLALLGIGAHKGIDFSIDMPDKAESFQLLGVTIILPDSTILDDSPDYGIRRMNWERTWMNFGGKFYVEKDPVAAAATIIAKVDEKRAALLPEVPAYPPPIL